MHRCLELAKLGAGFTAPNPMVGAILVYDEKIIGEGYHQKFGEAHAEVNCINDVADKYRQYISSATLYVSLEPCAHFGKTPPCVDMIVQNKIPQVIIGCSDPFEDVNGKGIEKLKSAGVKVVVGILEKECTALNKRFFTFHKYHRPYIILKWAESSDKKIAGSGNKRVFISNEETNRLVHKWRSEEASILVGTNTAMLDDPELTNRIWSGPSPVRFVLDLDLRLPDKLKLFDRKKRTVIFNKYKNEEEGSLIYCQVKDDKHLVKQMVEALYEFNIHSVLVEGGGRLLQSFIDEGLWDEIRRIQNRKLTIGEGLSAPVLPNYTSMEEMKIKDDLISMYVK